MSEVLIVFGLLAVLALVRNQLTLRWQLRAIDEAHAINTARINAGHCFQPGAAYDQIPDYFDVLFDLTVWSYRSPFGLEPA